MYHRPSKLTSRAATACCTSLDSLALRETIESSTEAIRSEPGYRYRIGSRSVRAAVFSGQYDCLRPNRPIALRKEPHQNAFVLDRKPAATISGAHEPVRERRKKAGVRRRTRHDKATRVLYASRLEGLTCPTGRCIAKSASSHVLSRRLLSPDRQLLHHQRLSTRLRSSVSRTRSSRPLEIVCLWRRKAACFEISKASRPHIA